MRGYYGEGLKLASAHFALSGVPVYIFTKRHVFKFLAIPKGSDNPRIFVLMGKANREVEGTEILLHSFRIDDDVLNRMVSFYNRDLKGKRVAEIYSISEECAYERPPAIYDHPNLLYIRNMFVGNCSDVARRRSLLSYDLWWFRLDVSRTLMTYSVPKLFEEARRRPGRSPRDLRRGAPAPRRDRVRRRDRRHHRRTGLRHSPGHAS